MAEKYMHLWMRNMQHHAKYYARRTIKRCPNLYIPYSQWRHRSPRPDGNRLIEPQAVRGDTEIVIEGPQRSGNTFAVVAFQVAQHRDVRIAHHLHAAAQVIVAVKKRIPTIVLLREPEEVVVSNAASFPPLTVKQALNEYIQFYSQIIPYRYNFLTAKFETVICDFDIVIRAVNEMAGMHFNLFNHTDENVARCFQIIEERYLAQSKPERTVARPSEDRRSRKVALRSDFHAAELAKLRSKASKLYESMKATAL